MATIVYFLAITVLLMTAAPVIKKRFSFPKINAKQIIKFTFTQAFR